MNFLSDNVQWVLSSVQKKLVVSSHSHHNSISLGARGVISMSGGIIGAAT